MYDSLPSNPMRFTAKPQTVMHYLNSFKPLCLTAQGRHAVERFGFPPFIDASCRREPDFQSEYPSISALCRGAMFAPRLRVGDRLIYMTVKSGYAPERVGHRRLVAALRVVERFASHGEAATWYREKGLPVPSNCLVDGNAPLPYEMTGGVPDGKFGEVADAAELLRRWNASYKLRARRHGAFLVCETEYINLHEPPVLTDEMLRHIFGRTPPTLTPPPISESEYVALRRAAVAL